MVVYKGKASISGVAFPGIPQHSRLDLNAENRFRLMQRICTTILALVALAVVLPNVRTVAQEAHTETVLIQGSEKYPARIQHGRVALILSEEIIADASRYKDALEVLGGEPISTLPQNVIGIEAPSLKDAKSLSTFAQDRANSRPDLIVDSGILVTIGSSNLPLVLTDKIIVQLAEGEDLGLIQQIAREFGAEVIGGNPFDERQFVIRVLPNNAQNALDVSNAINGRSGVIFAQPNFYRPVELRQAAFIPNDTFFANQWHLNNTGQGSGTVDADIDADLAWSFGLGDPNVTIAVIDRGFEKNHPDLAAALYANSGETAGNGIDDDGNGLVDDINGWDFTTCTMNPTPPTAPTPPFPSCGDNDVAPVGAENHGTAVAGAALARANNNIGVSGTCPRCTFLPIRAISGSDFAHGLAVAYAQAMGADIISNSWGYPVGIPVPANVVAAINSAATAGRGGLGSVVLFAMPNNVVDRCGGMAPDISSLPNVIAVSGVTNQDVFASAGYGSCMDVLSPTDYGTLDGVTTDRQGTPGYNSSSPNPCGSAEPSNLDYTFCLGGNSFGVAVVAGVAGLILSHDNSLTRLQVQRLLQDTADKVSDSAGAYSEQTGFSAPAGGAAPTHGYGRINAFEAVRTVAARAAGGRGGVDIYLRDNRLDWGNTEQLSNVTFEQTRGYIPHWRSVDIKIDAPPYLAAAPATSAAFDAFVHENPLSNTLNRVYVRVHNRGTTTATGVRVKLHWAFAGAGLPALPNDFWTLFPADSALSSAWHPIPIQTASVPYSGASVAGGANDGAVVLSFDFNAPAFDATLPNPDHYCLFAVVDADDDPVSAVAKGSLVPDFITPRDNNVTHRNVQLLDSGGSGGLSARMFISNPFDYPIETRLDAWLPKHWKFAAAKVEAGKMIKLSPGKSVPVEISITPDDAATASVDVVQLYRTPEMKEEEVLGGITYDVAPRRASFHLPLIRSEIVGLIGKHQALVAEYQKLVAEAASKPDLSIADRTLIGKMGDLLDDEGRLIGDLEKTEESWNTEH